MWVRSDSGSAIELNEIIAAVIVIRCCCCCFCWFLVLLQLVGCAFCVSTNKDVCGSQNKRKPQLQWPKFSPCFVFSSVIFCFVCLFRFVVAVTAPIYHFISSVFLTTMSSLDRWGWQRCLHEILIRTESMENPTQFHFAAFHNSIVTMCICFVFTHNNCFLFLLWVNLYDRLKQRKRIEGDDR